MESVKIYQRSYEELQRVRKNLTNTGSITIDFSKLDSTTSEELKSTIEHTVISRCSKVSGLISKASAQQ